MNHIAGFHAAHEALKGCKGSRQSGTLLISGKNPKLNQIIKDAEKSGIEVKQVSVEELNKICGRKVHRGVILFLEDINKKISSKIRDLKIFVKTINTKNSIILLLDNITDPGNFGAILRSADLFDVDAIVVPSKKSVKVTQTVRQTSSGASEYIPVITVSNLSNALRILKDNDYWIFGADMSGFAVDKENLKRKIGLVLGSEGKGIKQVIMNSCDSLIKIPQGGHIDSFNVSVAAGILLYEIRRQQTF